MQRDVKGLILLIPGTDHITEVMAPMAQATAQDMQLTRAPLRSRSAIGHIIIAALVITWAAPITSGGRDIGHRVTVEESGSTATTLLDKRTAGCWFSCISAGVSH